MYKFLKALLSLVVIAICVYVSQVPIHNLYGDIIATYFPCQQPITYTLGEFDSEFGISQTDFLNDIDTAKGIWEKALGRPLFIYNSHTSNANLKINLVYDYRQKATVSMQKLGGTLDMTQTSYNTLKSRYDTMQLEYTQKKAIFDTTVAAFQKDKSLLTAKIANANAHGGITHDQQVELTAEETAINNRAIAIQRTQTDLNTEVSLINTLVTQLNQAASTLNFTVDKFNAIGQSTGDEFNEALYVQDATGNHIDVFQYSNNDKLVRVLTHELGHALGLEHVDDPNAIMYKLNQSSNIVPTKADVGELKRVCQVK